MVSLAVWDIEQALRHLKHHCPNQYGVYHFGGALWWLDRALKELKS